jgi:hypothetical protein
MSGETVHANPRRDVNKLLWLTLSVALAACAVSFLAGYMTGYVQGGNDQRDADTALRLYHLERGR